MRIDVKHGIGDLAADAARVPPKAAKSMRTTVNTAARLGNQLAKDSARRTAGKHGKHYPNAMTWEPRAAFYGFGTGLISAEYGPEIGRPQGGMSFERGSRNQSRPHLNLARSADIIGGTLAQEIRSESAEWFW